MKRMVTRETRKKYQELLCWHGLYQEQTPTHLGRGGRIEFLRPPQPYRDDFTDHRLGKLSSEMAAMRNWFGVGHHRFLDPADEQTEWD